MTEPANYEEAPGNDELRFIGAFGRKTKVGKHQACNRHHLRAVIETLDAAGLSDAADTLVWQVWHRENSVARAHEFLRLANAGRDAAKAELAELQAEGLNLRAALEHVKFAANDLASVCIAESDCKSAGALQFISGLIDDRMAAVFASTGGRSNQ